MKLNTSEIKPNPNNPRFIKDGNFKKLVQSLKDFPEMADVREVVVNKDHVILGGNMRFKAMQEAGWTEVPVKVVDWPEDKQQEFVIKDNVSGGDWDWDLLANEWDMELLQDWGLELPTDWGEEVEVEEDEAPEVSSEPAKSVLGEVYQLGRHSVMCGDSTDFGATTDLLDSKTIDLVFSDPPYGIEIVGKDGKVGAENIAKNQVYSDVIGDETTDTAKNFYGVVSELSNKIILWGGNYFTEFLPFSPSWIIWDKRGEMTSNNFADGEMAWCSFNTRVRVYKQIWNGMIREGESEKRVHPTQKPLQTLANIIKDFSKKNDLIYDGFLGSGSTLIACEQTDRTCYGMELDPKYVDVIRKRYAKFIDPENWEAQWEKMTPAI